MEATDLLVSAFPGQGLKAHTVTPGFFMLVLEIEPGSLCLQSKCFYHVTRLSRPSPGKL